MSSLGGSWRVHARFVTYNQPPVADEQTLSTDEDTPLTLTLTATDPDADSLTYTVANAPTPGTLSGTAPNLTYTPDADFNGQDTFTFVANDGTVDSGEATVTVDVAPVNDAPAISTTAPSDATEDQAYSYEAAH